MYIHHRRADVAPGARGDIKEGHSLEGEYSTGSTGIPQRTTQTDHLSLEMICERWVNQIAPGYTDADEQRYDLAVAILDHLDLKSMTATVRVTNLAREACIGLKSTRRLIAGLVRRGHLEFHQGNGRGRISTFRPILLNRED